MNDLPIGARFCPACGLPASAALPDSITAAHQAFARAERKLVTVLFADFQGYTAFAANRDAEEVHEFIVNCWAQLAPLIQSHGGRLEKYIGDAIMALFGAEQAREEDPARAIQAALAIQSRLCQLKVGGKQPVLPMRIGIHTGLVVIQTQRGGLELRASGDTVNLADRLQKLAPPGGVLISQDTFRHVAGLFDVQSASPLLIDGREHSLQTHVVLRAKPRALARRMQGVEGTATRMVGRAEEMKLLQTAFLATVETQESHIITVAGEPGLGKSRLAQEFQTWLETIPVSVRIFSGRATAETKGSPFALLRDILAERFGIQDGDSSAIAREKLEAGVVDSLATQIPMPGELPAAAVAHFLGHLAGFDFSSSSHLQGVVADTEQFRACAFQSAVRFFTATSHGTDDPLKSSRDATLLVAEDIHWSDEGSLALIAHLATACSRKPVMIICLTRPEFFEKHPEWGGNFSGHTVCSLLPLPERDGRVLTQQILSRAPEIPRVLLERVAAAAEGNPFYIEEIIKMLIERGVIVAGSEHWKIELPRLAHAILPPTLTGVLQSRLDALQELERMVAQRASVLGRVFWDKALIQLEVPGESELPQLAPPYMPLAPSQIAKALAGLDHKQIISRRETSSQAGAVEYTFNHDLLRSVAYESLLKRSRQRLHERAATWLIHQGGERISESANLVAAHFEKAGRANDAAGWYGRAGEHAWASYAPSAAVESFSKALELSDSKGSGIREMGHPHLVWLNGLAEALGAQAKSSEACDAYLRMRELAGALQDALAEARAWNGLAFLNERLGDNHASLKFADLAIEICGRIGVAGHAEFLKALYFKGWAYYRLADAEQVLRLAGQSADLARQLADPSAMARSHKLHGVAHLQLGQYADAERYFLRGLELSETSGDLRTASAMWSNRGETARARGDHAAAVGLYQKAIAISRQIGACESELIYLCNLNAARIGLRQFAEAEAGLRDIISEATTARSWNLSEIHALLSEACLAQGKTVEALESAHRALELAQSTQNSLYIADAWRALGRAQARTTHTGEHHQSDYQADDIVDGPGHCFQQSLLVYQRIGARGEQGRTLKSWAEIDLRRQCTESARTKLQEARVIFLELGLGSEVDAVTSLLSDAASSSFTTVNTPVGNPLA